jgi:demethylmenaquinone methyltransferase / 2-methoxy-6-polyprenyl-1,4-benzoquinol methylase
VKSERKQVVVGAVPRGARDPEAAAHAVREMFTSIAHHYDLLNHVLSFNVDRVWWRRAARTFKHILRREDVRVLDLCCGTGDMTLGLWRVARRSGTASLPKGKGPGANSGGPQILGADFSHAMLQRARVKSEGTSLRWVEGDALTLPFAAEQFDLITSAFGFRNLADYDAGLREIVRVLKPGGECGILDFGEPRGFAGQVYRIYFRHVLPKLGTWISGVRGPYAYLPASVERFPPPDEMLDRMRQAGFREVSWTPYTLGIAGLYWGKT